MVEYSDGEGDSIVSHLEPGLYHLMTNSCSNLLYERIKELFRKDYSVATYGDYEWEMGLNFKQFCKRAEPELLFIHNYDRFFKECREEIKELSETTTVVVEFGEHRLMMLDEKLCNIQASKGVLELYI